MKSLTRIEGILSAVLMLLCGLAVACGSDKGSAVEPAVAADLSAALPLPDELRGFSGVEPLNLPGTATVLRSPGFEELILEPGVGLLDASDGGPFEWAVYSFIVSPGELSGVGFDVEARLAGSSVFVGMADFNADRWVFNSPFELPDSGTAHAPALGPIDPARHQDEEGNYFVALVVPEGSLAAVHSLAGVKLVNDPPVAALSADPQQADAPVNVTYDASASSDIDGTIVQYEWDMQGDGVFELNTGSEPTHIVNHTSPAVVNATVRVTDDDGASDTAEVQVLVTENGNVPPSAVLESDVSEGDGEAGFSVTFSSNQSSDLDGNIALYEWDLDGDSSTGTNGFEVSSAAPDEQLVQFDAPGERTVRLRVTDDGGLRSNDTLKIVSHGWVIVDTGAGPGGGFGFSLAQIGKFPALVFGSSGDLRFVQCGSEFGADPGDWSSVDLGQGNVAECSMAVVQGRAAVSFRGNGLQYARHSGGSALDAMNWQSVQVDSTPSVANSLVVVDGNPAIAYNTSGLKDELSYARSSTATGTGAGDWSSVVVDSEDPLTGQGCSLAVVNGKPAISYVFNGPGGARLRYAHSSSSTGSAAADWNLVQPHSGMDTRLFTSLAVVDGKPAFAFLDPGNNGVVFAFALTSDGASVDDWQLTVVDPELSNSHVFGLAVVDGLPHIGYGNNIPDGVSLASGLEALPDTISKWELDEDGVTGEVNNSPVALAEVNGYPAIVFNGPSQAVMYGIRF